MFSLLYDGIQLLAIIALLPKWIGRWIVKKDPTFLSYLGFFLPKTKPSTGLCFMFYAVSVGEVKAAASLFAKMKDTYPTASFFISCRTKTGLEEAKRSLPCADSYFLLPFDFSWISKRVLNRIRPDVILVIEGDLWYNLLRLAKVRGSQIFLISGKISARSYKRFSYFPKLAKKLFSLFNLICAQNKTFAERFVSLGARPDAVIVTGNIKLCTREEKLSDASLTLLQEKLGIKESDFVVVIGSTHDPEEREILAAFKHLWVLHPRLKCLIVPRHPERFSEVAQILVSSALPYISFSSIEQKTGQEKIILIDKMGLLSDLYQLADLAIVGGSFYPSLKGHNILEPIQKGTPVLFGPNMTDQMDLVNLIASCEAGIQVDLLSLASRVEQIMQDPIFLFDLQEKGKVLLETIRGSSVRTWTPIQQNIEAGF